MKILWFNWKDIKHPEAGGAEIYTHEIAKRLVQKEHEITLFVSGFDKCNTSEVIDGINIIRLGGRYSVYKEAKRFYERNKANYDLIIDEINTRPFLTPKFVKDKKVVALIHQLAREFWFYETPLPVAIVGYYLFENRWLENYVDIPTITVSESTKNDLQKLGFSDISIVHNGLNVRPVETLPDKNDRPTIVYVGRMKNAKRPQDVIDAFKIVNREIPASELWMIGSGYAKTKLEHNCGKNVIFHGYMEQSRKDELVKKAWVLAVPGVREGWGQVVTDSNALGTPAVGYDIPGLRDSIKSGYNGLLVGCNFSSLAHGLVEILGNRPSRETYSKNGIKWASQLSWDKSAQEFERVLESV